MMMGLIGSVGREEGRAASSFARSEGGAQEALLLSLLSHPGFFRALSFLFFLPE